MIRPCLAALAALLGLVAGPTPAPAQGLPYYEVQCSAHLVGVGTPELSRANAQRAAVDAWNALARQAHGAATPFDFIDGMTHRSRLSMSCSSGGLRTTCEARGRACTWVMTTRRNTEVASACPWGTTRTIANNLVPPCRPIEMAGVVPFGQSWRPRCPSGYTLRPNQAMCQRN